MWGRLRQDRRTPVVVTLLLIIVLGACLRFYALSTIPTELIPDEIDLYNSINSFVHTGHDVDGSSRIFLYNVATRNPPMAGVLQYASTLVFGRSAFGLRFPAALLGTACIPLLFGIAFAISRRSDVALVAAALQATQPLFVQFSRIAWEPSTELPFLLGGLLLLLLALRPEKRLNRTALFAAAIVLGLACYTYPNTWLYAFLLGGSYAALNLRGRPIAELALVATAAACATLIALPALWSVFFDPGATAKVHRIFTFSSGLNAATLAQFFANDIAHYRYDYLATTGDPQPGTTWRFLNGFGALSPVVLPLTLIGLFAMDAFSVAKRVQGWLLFWLLVYPVGGALTIEGIPNAPRTLGGAPVFCLLAAFGAAAVLSFGGRADRKNAARGRAIAYELFALVLLFSTARFAHDYTRDYVHRNSNAWDSGIRGTLALVQSLSPPFRTACFSIRPGRLDIDQYLRFYLGDSSVHTIDTIESPPCFAPRTILVVDHHLERPGFFALTTTLDVDGNPFAYVYARSR